MNNEMNHWSHAPFHLLNEQGIYILTAGTYHKTQHFKTPERLDFLQKTLLEVTTELGWELHAWAVFSNHYHFVGVSPKDPSSLKNIVAQLHHQTAVYVNKLDNTPNRKVWHQYWESQITFQKSYLARLNYVHNNPVKHRLVTSASDYPWCSARDFEARGSSAFVKSVYGFDYKKVHIVDDYE